jgi:aspartate aminotransferase
MKIAAKAIELRSKGIDIIDFSVGEPDFYTPYIIKEAGKKAIDNNLIKYTVNAGLYELRKAISAKLLSENQLTYSASQIIISNGAKQSIFNAIMALVEQGDDVLIPAPYYVSYPEMVKFANAQPLIIPTAEREGFKINAELLEKSITPKSKLLILCNPSNPSGLLYTKDELKEIAAVVNKYGLYVISDEVYEKLVYDKPFCSFSSVDNKVFERTIIINGASKAFAMTGWRLGYAAGPAKIIEAMDKIQSHSTSAASAVAQYAVIEALESAAPDVQKMVDEYKLRRNTVMAYLDKVPHISYAKPDGAFYVFPNISYYINNNINSIPIKNSYDLSLYLLENVNVNTVPGAVFGSDKHIRIAYSTSMENIHKGMERLSEGLNYLS